jgi:hypothetical protein
MIAEMKDVCRLIRDGIARQSGRGSRFSQFLRVASAIENWTKGAASSARRRDQMWRPRLSGPPFMRRCDAPLRLMPSIEIVFETQMLDAAATAPQAGHSSG